ncbi:heparin lyase I family protein [Paraburkholderia flava]|uniref:heparin lyase I family protein n=1 Tax=Paraburkholderia flava TaxID=2547393 RepID=UPI00105F612A|nr:heparin lyase I family protein [Paraburkholderia flava]
MTGVARFRFQRYTVALFAVLLCTTVHAEQASMAGDIDMFHKVYETAWKDGLGSDAGIQSSRQSNIALVDDPLTHDRKVVRVHIERSENFSKIINGLPRAEFSLPPDVRLKSGHHYLIRWSTLLPSGFSFDGQQMAIITQIHQSASSGGSPPFMLTLMGSDYTVSERGGTNTVHGRGARICCASGDVGRWIHWTLLYTPDAEGSQAVTQLLKDGVKVFDSHGMPNAYPDDQRAYLKFGVYKPGWQQSASDVDQITLFYGPISVLERRE